MNICVYFRNCLKAVILLWTGIIAFNASVTGYVLEGNDVRSIKVTYCGGLLRSIDIYYVDIRNGGPLKDFFDFLQLPGSIGPVKRLVIPYNQSWCDGVNQTVELPVQLLEATVKKIKFPPPQKQENEWDSWRGTGGIH
ncbi:unnamed protein product [Macrosiphum euphorbiae]|uniref:Uncharacterized protein n=1 Tax=Macrosiphum euphorbiae TaxID=13131 RepID=A0AAV0X0Q7_9HEMI|nr:unnamed protein product [Macrosiphum euphorbiae]